MSAVTTEHIPAPAGTAGFATAAKAIAGRTVRKMLRTPQVLGIAIVQSIVFLLMFRYCLLYTSPSPRDGLLSRMPSSA